MTIRIRPTEPADRPDVIALVTLAFTAEGEDGSAEVHVVTSTWAQAASPVGMDLVALEDDKVIGHVMAAVGSLDGTPALGIAPLCVAPSHHNTGVGTALMHALLERIDEDWPFSVLLGAPEYYERFGFEAASRFGLVYPLVGEHPAFQVRLRSPESVPPPGHFVYCFEDS